MDHDVITSNDFAGEAFLSLNSIPGVLAPLPHDLNAIDRVDLILMHQQNKGKQKMPFGVVRPMKLSTSQCIFYKFIYVWISVKYFHYVVWP